MKCWLTSSLPFSDWRQSMPDDQATRMRRNARVAHNELATALHELADISKRVSAAMEVLSKILEEPKP